jgi:hypothetical protein
MFFLKTQILLQLFCTVFLKLENQELYHTTVYLFKTGKSGTQWYDIIPDFPVLKRQSKITTTKFVFLKATEIRQPFFRFEDIF